MHKIYIKYSIKIHSEITLICYWIVTKIQENDCILGSQVYLKIALKCVAGREKSWGERWEWDYATTSRFIKKYPVLSENIPHIHTNVKSMHWNIGFNLKNRVIALKNKAISDPMI